MENKRGIPTHYNEKLQNVRLMFNCCFVSKCGFRQHSFCMKGILNDLHEKVRTECIDPNVAPLNDAESQTQLYIATPC